MAEFSTATGVIFYEVVGPTAPGASGEPLTLLHNFMSTGQAAWGPLLERLAAEYRVILPDLPGHGQSVGYPYGFSHLEMARQMAALMAHEDADQGHVAGCSSGGMIAQLLVNDGLAAPATLTLVSTTHSTDPRTTGAGACLVPENFQAGRKWMEATARLHDPFHYDGYYEEIVLAGFRRLTGKNSIDLPLDALATWTLPVCLIHGEEDEFFPPSVPSRMAAVLADAELHLIPGQSHALIFRRPWNVAELMVDFLRRHPISAARMPQGDGLSQRKGGQT